MKLKPAQVALLVFAVVAGAGVFAYLFLKRKVKVNASVSVDEEGVTFGRVIPTDDGAIYVDG